MDSVVPHLAVRVGWLLGVLVEAPKWSLMRVLHFAPTGVKIDGAVRCSVIFSHGCEEMLGNLSRLLTEPSRARKRV